jgi:Flp pilus assembly protein TadG
MSAARRVRDERGAALVEFAIFLPLLVIVTLGTVDFGRAYLLWNQVKNAAREGAAYAQLHPGEQAVSPAGCDDPDNIRWHARAEAGTASAGFGVTVTPAVPGGCDPSSPPVSSGDDITVTVTSPFTVLTPLLRQITGNPTVRASVTVRVQ